MSMLRLSFINFRNGFKSYLSLVLSLSFSILILFNFQNMIYSETFAVLGQRNKQYIDMLIQTVSIVLLCFLFFFVWYATNVFLTRRKREIGIYIFMGMSNRKIGSLYMIEISFVGITALAAGIGFGALFAGLFQMVMGAVADTEIEVRFGISIKPVVLTVVFFLAVYVIFVLKGYWNIVRSSVLSMISAARQNEYVQTKSAVLFIKAAAGILVLAVGYFLANKGSRSDLLGNALLAVVLVMIGVYLLFGGLVPLFFQMLAGQKSFLYRRQRCLWVNQTIFRMRKNYRTYAMVCIIGICSATALATGFAMRERYHNMMVFDNQYTFQFLTNQQGLGAQAAALIQGETEIACQTSLTALSVDAEHLVLSYSEVKRAAQESGGAAELRAPADDETYYLSHQILLSLIAGSERIPVRLGDMVFQETEVIREPYIGYMQEAMGCFYVVSDTAYEELRQGSEMLYIYNYKIADNTAFERARAAADVLISNTDENFTARVAVNPFDKELEWVKVLCALCIFMFLVFIVAGGCIMFMKLYNDSYEEKERYLVLKKIGLSPQTLSRSIAHELSGAYMLPFVVLAVSAYFSVNALGKMMQTDLFSVYLVSMLVVLLVFVLCYGCSVVMYRKNVGV